MRFVLVVILLALSTPALSVAQTPTTPCAVPLSAADADPTPRPATHRIASGEGVAVAVIDTGVAAHPQLGEVEAVADLVARATPDPLFDCDGHGTIVAGVIRDIAPGARLLSIRQSSAHYRTDRADTSGTLANLAEAIHLAIDARARVINVSVVSCVPAHQAPLIDARVLDDALHRAESEGVIVVAAAGNTGGNCHPGSVVYPAHSPTVVAVSATHSRDPHSSAEYSLPGEFSAPGIVAAGLSPSGEGRASGMTTGNGDASAFEGTSFAAPVVSGTAALLRERYPDETAAEIRERLWQAAEPGLGVVDPHRVLTYVAGPPLLTPSRDLMVEVPAPLAEPARERALLLFGLFAVVLVIGVLIRRLTGGQLDSPASTM